LGQKGEEQGERVPRRLAQNEERKRGKKKKKQKKKKKIEGGDEKAGLLEWGYAETMIFPP